jgi:guanylate kinase
MRVKNGKIFIISGPSGSGKTTLYKKLMASRKLESRLVKSVSVTTRPRRAGEKHGRDYLFVSPKMFAYKKRREHFLECEKVFGHEYGTPDKNVRDLLRAGKNVLLCIDVKGAAAVRRKFQKAVTVFIRTASLAVLTRRLKGRGSEQKDIMRLRLETARKELKEAKKYDYVIVNDDLRAAFSRLEAIIGSEQS